MRIQREEKGITLIALIITIIVLLILAGVSIAMLTGENGILKRAEGTEVTQAQAELTEEMQLAIMESLIDIDNTHTIDNVLQIAVANSYISIGNKHTLLEPDPESSLLEVSSISGNANKYVTDECKSVLVVDTDIGVWVKLGQDGSNVTLEQGVGTMNVANLRTLEVIATVGDPDGNKNVTITVEAILEANSSKESSYIEKITGPDGEEITPIETFAGSNGDVNGRVTYEATTNGVYTFTAREANGGTAAGSAIVSESNTAKIEMTADIEKGKWSLNNEVKVTIEYDQWTNESLQYKVGTGTWQTAGSSSQVVTVTENTTIEARYGTDDTTKETYTVAEIDTTVPTKPEFTIEEIGTTSFKINIGTVSTDGQTGLKEYIVYVDGDEVGTIGATETEYTVEKLDSETTYEVKIVAVDMAENETASDIGSVTTKRLITGQLSDVVSVGDYIAYDAGEWTQADFDLIKASSGSPTVNGTTSLPTTQGEFGGYTIGQSRNSNSTESNSNYKPRTEGWRVWSIEGDEVTIVHAGHSESYYHASNGSVATTNILRNRNTEMYENEYAESSRIMEGTDAATWYNTQYGTSYVIVDNGGGTTSTFHSEKFTTEGAIEVLENGSHYLLAAPYSSSFMYRVTPLDRYVSHTYKSSMGVRVLVSLKSEVHTSGENEKGELELFIEEN